MEGAYTEKEWVAHISEDGRIQTVLEHLHGTANYCQKFASEIDSEKIGYLMGVMHDIGKYSEEFQRRILYEGHKVDHSTAGTWECYQHIGLGNAYFPMAFCIAGHHGGLPDGGSISDIGGKSLTARIKKAKESFSQIALSPFFCS